MAIHSHRTTRRHRLTGATVLPSGPAAACFPAAEAVAVLRAWRQWAAVSPRRRTTSMRIARLTEGNDVCAQLRGAAFLVSDELTAVDLAALGRHARGPLAPAPGVADLIAVAEQLVLGAVLEHGWLPVCDAVLLQRVDDWATESFVRAGTSLTPGLTCGLRNAGGAFTLFAYGAARDERRAQALESDVAALRRAMSPWLVPAEPGCGFAPA